jgi:hypothetical protein
VSVEKLTHAVDLGVSRGVLRLGEFVLVYSIARLGLCCCVPFGNSGFASAELL